MRVLDVAAVAAWSAACVRSLDVLRPAINGINVYPVADSDTGSNLLHTLTGARDALTAALRDPSAGGDAVGGSSPLTGDAGVDAVSPLAGDAAPIAVSPLTGDAAQSAGSPPAGDTAAGGVSPLAGEAALRDVSPPPGDAVPSSGSPPPGDVVGDGGSPLAGDVAGDGVSQVGAAAALPRDEQSPSSGDAPAPPFSASSPPSGNTPATEAALVDVAAALAILARGAVAAARGNSGVIISQVVRGIAEWAATGGELDGAGLAAALGHADKVATGAVSRPVAGTMLTVLHSVAGAVRGDTRPLADVAETVAATAAAALEETPKQLPALAKAGVVDAGGRGLVAVLDALAGVVTGKNTAPEHELEVAVSAPVAEPAPYAWEVMYLLDGVHEAQLPALRKELSGFGDSVTVAGDGSGSHAVHVHCADIGAAIEAGLDLGRPRRIRVEPLLTPTPIEPGGGLDRSVVAVVRGGGLAELLRAEGVAVLAVPDGETPGVEDMIGLFNEAAGRHVTVLPGSIDLTAAADTAAGHAMAGDRDVVVIPCASPVQVLAALAVHDGDRRANDDVVAMAEAAAATRRGELRIADEESLTWVGRAQSGDVIGLVDDEVVLIEPAPASETNLVAAAMGVLNRMLTLGGELVTVLGGADAPPGVAAELAEQLRLEHPEVELTSYASGQADAVLLMGVE
ncbi:DAK2 domain-containing protein [Amycolatopsis sp. NBC_00345]|uniref:DAK2 domain-containing protein n=1 Tax=Amycolatopsis sp. NBC_00345 TaxID=2975955 RepID=UPI002E2675D9